MRPDPARRRKATGPGVAGPRRASGCHSLMDYSTTAFDETSTALRVVAGIDLTGRTAIVSGAISGVGVETARAWPQRRG